jgi:hypothetical protein
LYARALNKSNKLTANRPSHLPMCVETNLFALTKPESLTFRTIYDLLAAINLLTGWLVRGRI